MGDLSGHVEPLEARDEWRLVVNLPPVMRQTRDGRPRKHYPRRVRVVTARGKKRALEALDTFIAELAGPNAIDPARLTIAGLLELWLDAIEGDVRPKTLERYRQLARQHLKPGLGDLRAAALEPSDWRDFDARLAKSGRLDGAGGLSGQTRKHLFRVLHRAYAWAVEEGKYDANPLARVPRGKRPSASPRRLATWTAGEVGDAIERARGTVLFVPAMLAGFCGMRRSEICGLTWDDVLFDDGLIVVRRSIEQTAGGVLHELEPKSKASERFVRAPAFVLDELREHKRAQDELRLAAGPAWNAVSRVCCRADGSPASPNAISTRWSDWVKRQGIRPYMSFHGLRHSYATNLYALGVRTKTISGRLGHSSQAITRDLYVHSAEGADLEALELQEAQLAALRAKTAQDSHSIRTRVSDLSEARARKGAQEQG